MRPLLSSKLRLLPLPAALLDCNSRRLVGALLMTCAVACQFDALELSEEPRSRVTHPNSMCILPGLGQHGLV